MYTKVQIIGTRTSYYPNIERGFSFLTVLVVQVLSLGQLNEIVLTRQNSFSILVEFWQHLPETRDPGGHERSVVTSGGSDLRSLVVLKENVAVKNLDNEGMSNKSGA